MLSLDEAEHAGKRDVFQAIADPTRRKILELLTNEEMAITTIADHFEMGRTAVNKHLHTLADAGLVSSRKIGRETRYALHPEPLSELKAWLSFFDHYWESKLSALRDYVEGDEAND